MLPSGWVREACVDVFSYGFKLAFSCVFDICIKCETGAWWLNIVKLVLGTMEDLTKSGWWFDGWLNIVELSALSEGRWIAHQASSESLVHRN